MENENVEPVLLNTITDAVMAFNQIAGILDKLNSGLTPEEKVQVREGFEGLSYTSMVILMDAEMDIEDRDKGGE